ncbi:MAG TPA: sigma-E factor regulatory protein RseB domain-containing protein, partial [Planctomycetota bacterium]|nr:sigma-E factor regulatory protein RseB domain-containing protein [Planctomycetota bacterium]
MKLPLCVAAFLLAAGAIAGGVLADVRAANLQKSLTSIEAAEEGISYVGTRVLGGAERIRLRIWSSNGHKRVDFLGIEGSSAPAGRPSGPRGPFGPGLPLFLRPGHDQWKRKIKDAALAVRNYDIVSAGSDTVAGRACEVLEVKARYEGRPSYRVAIDVENRFPLRYEVLSNGRAVFETWFSDIEYRPAISPLTFDERARPNWLQVSQQEVAADRMTEATGFSVLRPSALPRGFELRGSEVLHLKAEISKELRQTVRPFLPFPVPSFNAAVAHFTYTDGLAAVALVECSASSELWQHLKKFLPPVAGGKVGLIVARKFTDRGGTAYLLEHEGTVVLAAGNVAPDQIELMIRS